MHMAGGGGCENRPHGFAFLRDMEMFPEPETLGREPRHLEDPSSARVQEARRKRVRTTRPSLTSLENYERARPRPAPPLNESSPPRAPRARLSPRTSGKARPPWGRRACKRRSAAPKRG